MEPSPDARPADSPVAPALDTAPPGLLDAAYCGPEPDFTEIAAMYADIAFPR